MFKMIRKPVSLLAIIAILFTGYISVFSSIEIASADTTVSSSSLFEGQVIASSVEYGETFTVPVTGSGCTVTVYAPNSKVITPNAGVVTATELGIYEVVIADDSFSGGYYSYNVECYLDGDYVFLVDKDGATIPSNWEYDGSSSSSITLPDANVYVYDEANEVYIKDNTQTINAKVTSPNGTVTNYTADKSAGESINDKVALNQIGTWFVSYYTYIDGNESGEVFSEEYSIQVRQQFEDETAPKLSVASFSTNASVNTKVTLPTATATDDYDERVIVNISVMHTYEGTTTAVDVPTAVVDMTTGYATGVTEETALFDNSMFMYFYPTEVGTYSVVYTAEDTTSYYGIDTDNKTIEYVYTIKVTDSTAPVFDEIDDYQIPTTWSSTVYKYDGTTEGDKLAISDTNISFPIPTLLDNYDSADKLTSTFELTDVNGYTVAKFSDITATTHNDSNKYTPSGYLSTIGDLPYYFFDIDADLYTVSSEGLITEKATSTTIGYDFASVFNFSLWNPSYSGANKACVYTAEYKAYDSATSRNYRTQQYEITYVSGSTGYTDLTAPTLYYDAPTNIAFTENETDISINSVSVTDAGSSRLNTELYLVYNVSDATLSNNDFDTLANIETKIELDEANGSVLLEDVVIDGNNGTFVIDDYKGTRTEINDVDTAKSMYVALRSIDSVGNESVRVEEINVIDATDTDNKLATIKASTNNNTSEGQDGVQYVLGDFDITYATGDREQTGFELYVQRIARADGTVLTSEESPIEVSFETYSDNTDTYSTVSVDNVRFTPTNTGIYMVMLRAYNISGYSDAYVSYVTVSSNSESGSIVPAASLATISEINVTYSLETEYIGEEDSYVVRSITAGGQMSLMYDEFTAMTTGAYKISDYTAVPTNGEISYTSSYVPEDSILQSNQSATIQDNSSPVIKVQGVMPVYVENDATTAVVLPTVSAYSSNGVDSSIDCDITDEDGNDVEVTELEGNSFSFYAITDGTYTIQYTATVNGNMTQVEYTIKCGDVVAPQFTIVDTGLSSSTGSQIVAYIDDSAVLTTSSSSVSASVGDSFNFGIISVTDTDTSGYTYKKQLIASDGSIVDTVTSASSRGSSSSITFTMSGQYTVQYTATDEYGNETVVVYYITVNSSSINVSTEVITTLSVVLIIVGIVLVAGIIIFVVRFKKHSV